MASGDFDHDRWSDDLRALAAASDAASAAWLDHTDDKQLLEAFNSTHEAFRTAHHAWLREHPDRIPALIAHLRRGQRDQPYGYRDFEANERMRAWHEAEINRLWAMHAETRPSPALSAEPASPPQPAAPPGFTIEVTHVAPSYRTASFGVFDTVEEAERQADMWQRETRADGLAGLFITASAIGDLSAFATWIEPERRRVAQDRAHADLTAQRTRLLLEFHDDDAISELGPDMIAEAITQTGQFTIVSINEAAETYRRAAHAASCIRGRRPVAAAARELPESALPLRSKPPPALRDRHRIVGTGPDRTGLTTRRTGGGRIERAPLMLRRAAPLSCR